jgi:hypothetical protein
MPADILPWLLRLSPLLCQVIAYLAGLHHSGLWRRSLVVAPATVLRQWMGELRTWYPPLRVMLLHDSGRCPYGTPRPDKNGKHCLDLGLRQGRACWGIVDTSPHMSCKTACRNISRL